MAAEICHPTYSYTTAAESSRSPSPFPIFRCPNTKHAHPLPPLPVETKHEPPVTTKPRPIQRGASLEQIKPPSARYGRRPPRPVTWTHSNYRRHHHSMEAMYSMQAELDFSTTASVLLLTGVHTRPGGPRTRSRLPPAVQLMGLAQDMSASGRERRGRGKHSPGLARRHRNC